MDLKIQGLYEVTFRALLDQKWKYHITFKKDKYDKRFLFLESLLKSKAFMKLLSEPC
ncbi:hypothetical protein ZOSMA_125G00110 [Zostera marina]|uniref:Uncharacterized protein n=1 Tax=Zostera marina TaxID=29655 RepID=A0A0K9PZQ4_ZOSMR|nr:hypothetical protein ZOSMA_125G00110 [Zostera marina]